MAQLINEYKPKKYDHVSRPLNFKLIASNILKHHGIVVEPNLESPLDSKIVHFGGRDPSCYKVRYNTLKEFLGKHNQLYVYEHDEKELLDTKEIDAKIDEYIRDTPEYNFYTNNCEDVMCQILLKDKNHYVKQYNIRSVFKFLFKSACLATVITLGSIQINLIVAFLHKLKIKQFDVDPLDWHDNRLTDPNKRKVFVLTKKKKLNVFKIANYCIWGYLAVTTALKIKKKYYMST